MVKKKILVISSDPSILRLLRQNLSEEEYQIINTRHSEEEIRTALKNESPDLVIFDTGRADLTVDLLAAKETISYNRN